MPNQALEATTPKVLARLPAPRASAAEAGTSVVADKQREIRYMCKWTNPALKSGNFRVQRGPDVRELDDAMNAPG